MDHDKICAKCAMYPIMQQVQIGDRSLITLDHFDNYIYSVDEVKLSYENICSRINFEDLINTFSTLKKTLTITYNNLYQYNIVHSTQNLNVKWYVKNNKDENHNNTVCASLGKTTTIALRMQHKEFNLVSKKTI